MESNQLEKVKSSFSTTGKMFVVGFLVIVCFIASLFTRSVVDERIDRGREAEREIANSWGKTQLIAGPVITLPVDTRDRDSNGILRTYRKNLFVLPDQLDIETTLEPQTRSRGIFNTVVYTTKIKVSGFFSRPDMTKLGLSQAVPMWHDSIFSVGITDTRGMTDKPVLSWHGEKLPLQPGNRFSMDKKGVHAPLGAFAPDKKIPFSFEISLNGSQGIHFIPVGDETTVSVESSWDAPSFVGAFLPTKQDVSDEGFSATWNVSSFGRSYPQAWAESSHTQSLSRFEPVHDPYSYKYGRSISIDGGGDLVASSFGVNLFREITFYTQVDRTTKYAILFITLTFLAFFLFEVISGLRIHPFQYLLVGAALVVFYLLLLSFAEHIGFGIAYLVASAMTIVLIGAYAGSVLKAHKRAWGVTWLLIALYLYLYIVLQLEEFALLFGTLLLFVALATVMYVTRKIDWYKARS